METHRETGAVNGRQSAGPHARHVGGMGCEFVRPGYIPLGARSRRWALFAILLTLGNRALATEASSPPPLQTDDAFAGRIAYKLTPSHYHVSDGNHGTDINLRLNLEPHTVWLGYYRDRADFQQARSGYERTFGTELGRLTLSAQVASRGFIGGSATAELGGDTFAILGWGRTNLGDYYNLNFDPNDAVTYGLGSHLSSTMAVSLSTTRDDRLGTGQRVTHLIYRHGQADTQRLTVDLFLKSGRTDENTFITANGIAITYDFRAYFVRVARDPHVNFTANDMTRISVGAHF